MKDRVSILGTEYSVELKELKDSDIDGYCDYSSKHIVIRSDNANKIENFEWLQNKQLRHEIIHAFMAESGLQANWQHLEQFGHEETVVDWFAIQSPKIFKVYAELGLINVMEMPSIGGMAADFIATGQMTINSDGREHHAENPQN